MNEGIEKEGMKRLRKRVKKGEGSCGYMEGGKYWRGMKGLENEMKRKR